MQNHIIQTDWFQRQEDYTIYLLEITGHQYSFAIASNRKWGSENAEVEEGTFYQLMRDREDDGFFDWYCAARPYEQFFHTELEAMLLFVHNWMRWKGVLAVQSDRMGSKSKG